MSVINPTELMLGSRPPGMNLTQWLYAEIRQAILDGRLRRGALIPPSRRLASQYKVSRRIVVNVFDQLRDEGYLTALTGAGTRVNGDIPEDFLAATAAVRERLATQDSPATGRLRVRPFLPVIPSLESFPIATWAKLEARSLRRMPVGELAGGDPAGLLALRSAIADHLGVSRGVPCSADQVFVTSGTQQSIDMLARVLLRPGDRVWIEDPGYKDAADIFRLAGARVVPVPVDDGGFLMPATRRAAEPKAIYLTPAHQFPLGVSLRLDRRLDLLRWTAERNAFLVEDDYDSEFRFSGRPIPAMKGLGGSSHVFLLGTFNKTLFPSLRIGYVVAPSGWIEPLIRLRRLTDRYPAVLPQRTLAAFLEEGHFARHLRRMRELYAGRLGVLRASIQSRLGGVVSLPDIEAGLNTPASFDPSIAAAAVAERARLLGLEVWDLSSFAFARRDLNGVLLGFAPFTEREIRAGVAVLAKAVDEVRRR